jgi:hypothetical protein
MNMRCGHILLLSFAYCSPVPFALGWFYSDIWAKRKAVIRITIRSIIWGGTPEEALLGPGSQPFLVRIASCKPSICRIHLAPVRVAAVGTSPNSSLTLRKHLLLRAFDLWPFLLIGISIIGLACLFWPVVR